jgi:hypothetical protein
MKDRATWLGLLGLLVVVVVLVVLGHPGTRDNAPDHRVSSDAANGTSALRLYAEALGHRTDAMEASFTIPQDTSLLFLFSPDRPVTDDEAQALRRWVQGGGVLVYASEGADVSVETAMDLSRSRGGPGPTEADAPAPALAGVHHLTGGPVAVPFQLRPQQVALLRNRAQAVLGLSARVGQGQLIALADPIPLCNGFLDKADNGRFAADLLGLSTGLVVFDEYHHGAGAASSETQWLTTPWGAALGWAAFVVFMGLGLRGRAFGPRVPLVASTDRSTAEYASAIGSLLRRTGARQVTLSVLAAGARRMVADRLGLGKDVQDRRFPEMLARRAPEIGSQLASTESRIPIATTDRDVLEISRELHQLAFPAKPLPSRNKKEP